MKMPIMDGEPIVEVRPLTEAQGKHVMAALEKEARVRRKRFGADFSLEDYVAGGLVALEALGRSEDFGTGLLLGVIRGSDIFEGEGARAPRRYETAEVKKFISAVRGIIKFGGREWKEMLKDALTEIDWDNDEDDEG